MKQILLIFIAFFISACGAKLEMVDEKTLSKAEFNDLNLSTNSWWNAYNEPKINEFLNFVLEKNADVNIARLSFLSAVARADLINYDLYPSLNGSFGVEKSRNLNTGVSSEKSFSNSLNLSYELDIYGKLIDSANASEFSARASGYDLAALKLSIINTAINGIFELAYFNDVQVLLKDYISNLEQMRELFLLKYELGKVEELDFLNTEQSLLRARQNLLTNEQNRNALIKTLKDLINDESGYFYIDYFSSLSLAKFGNLSVNYNIPLNAFSYRPDVRASLNKLKAAFKDYSSVQKSILPSISLSGGLRGSDNDLNDSFKFEILSGAIQISLPFLDYHRVKKNIKISQLAYESLVFSYSSTFSSAVNEFWLNEKNYQNYSQIYANLTLINEKQKQITQAYLQKYTLGKSELKDYLDALNALNSNAQDLLRSRYNLLNTINFYYQITNLSYEELLLDDF